MPTLMETSRRLVLRYDKGQYTFRRLDEASTPTEMHTLASHINAIQVDPVEKIVLVRTIALVVPA